MLSGTVFLSMIMQNVLTNVSTIRSPIHETLCCDDSSRQQRDVAESCLLALQRQEWSEGPQQTLHWAQCGSHLCTGGRGEGVGGVWYQSRRMFSGFELLLLTKNAQTYLIYQAVQKRNDQIIISCFLNRYLRNRCGIGVDCSGLEMTKVITTH